MAQVEKYTPPPNPAKVTDSRYEAYRQRFGEYSWELDALDPLVLTDIIRRAVMRYCDPVRFEARKAKQERARHLLRIIHQRWSDVVNYLKDNPRA